jgi:HD-like signal output (HDOD) protein
VATALLCDLLAQRVPVEFPEGAFLGGLFHDVGRLLIAVGLPEEHQQVMALYTEGQLPLIQCEGQVLGLTHTELSAAAMTSWRLPDAICGAVADHHVRDLQTADVRLGTHRLASLIRCADLYLNAAGISVEKERTQAEETAGEPFSPLGLEAGIPDVIEEFHAEYEALAHFFR